MERILFKRANYDPFTFLSMTLILYVIFAAISVATIEILSLFGLLSVPFCRFIFIIIILIYILIILFTFPFKKLLVRSSTTGPRRALLVLNLVAFLETVIYKPNNWDSLTYHLPRIEHWLNNHSLAYYSTDIVRQIWEQPFGDFLTLIPRVIFGNDNLDGIFSFISLIIFEISVFLILKYLQVDIRIRDYCVLLTLTPLVVLESCTTQVDLRGSAIALAAVAILFTCESNFSSVSGLGFAIALGIKITCILPLVPLILLPKFRTVGKIKLSLKHISMLGIGLLLNVPWLMRNFAQFGSFSGPAASTEPNGFAIIKLAESPGLLFARIFGWIFANLGLPGFNTFNHELLRFSTPFLTFFRQVDYPRSSYWPNLSDAGFGINEDLAPSAVVVIFSVLVILFIFINRHWKYLIYLISPLIIFFSVVEWQAFVNRLFLTGFALLAISLGLYFSDFLSLKRIWVFRAVALTSAAVSIMFLLFSGDRGVLRQSVLNSGRYSEYFNQQPYLARDYYALSKFIQARQIKRVDIHTTENSWEYPLWAMNSGVNFSKNQKNPQMYICLDACKLWSDLKYKKEMNFGLTIKVFI